MNSAVQYYKQYPSPKFVMPLGTSNIWAGSLMKPPARDPQFVLTLDVYGSPRPEIEANDGAKLILPKVLWDFPQAPTLTVDWPDGHVPEFLGREWWQELHSFLATGLSGQRVFIGCLGGMGRTGTALSILYGLEHPHRENPIDDIRETYHYDAVETEAQVDYIGAILQKEFPETYGSYSPRYDWYEAKQRAEEASGVSAYASGTPEEPDWSDPLPQDQIEAFLRGSERRRGKKTA